MKGTPLLPVLLLLLPGGAAAAGAATEGPEGEEAYVVRFLVFQHQGYWDSPALSGGPFSSQAIRPQERGLERLPGSTVKAGKLPNFWAALSRDAGYRPLLQGIAVPPARSQAEARPVLIDVSRVASIRTPFAALDGVAGRPLRQAVGQTGKDSGPETGNWAEDRVQGTLTFHKGRYPHLTVDLWFREVQRWMPWGPDVRYYALHQSRRMKADRYYYFDHPRFGVLARIQKAEAPR